MTKIVPISAVLFDMDGTLEDSEPLHYEAYRMAVLRYDVVFTEAQYRRFTGQTDRVICEWLVQQFKLPITAKQLLVEKEALYPEIAKAHATPLPGVVRILQALKSWSVKVGVASSSTRAVIELTLKALKINQYIQAIASGEEVANSKPFPDVYLLGASRLHTYPAHILSVEDSANGVASAKAAGLHCLARPCEWTRDQDLSKADVKVDSLEDVIITGNGLLAGDTLFRMINR